MQFLEDDEGFVWVSTYGGGLNRFDPSTEKFLRFTEGNSKLPNNGVYGALPDKNGFLWISTNNGITKFDPKTFEFRNYTVDDGLQSEEFNGGSYHLAHNGEMFFGGIKGFNSFIPEEVSDNKYIPNIVITDFKIFNESIQVGESSPLKQEITKTSEINLEYWQNDILFEYVALHYSNPSKNKYAFKLENYEDQWRYVGNTRIATYTNLDPGEYVFKVKGSNNDGLWNEEGKSIKLIISPPWWKTNLAYASYAFLFLFGLFSVDRYQKVRIKRLEQRKAQLALLQAENKRKTEELEEARNLQLSMLPKSLPQIPNLDIAVYMKTATEVGGDYYDFHVHLDGTLTVVLGDATGHGMMSGMMVSIMKSLFMADRSSKELKSFFNNSSQAIKDMQLNRLMMALTCIQFKGDTIKIANAGMPSLYMHKNKSAEIIELAVSDLPLGAMKEYDYEVREEIVETGDTLLMMSDGFPELTNSSNEMIGYTRTAKLFEEAAAKSPEDIVAYLNDFGNRWTDGKENEDDITFVVIKVK
ncbi:MAG: SpoIIE family protein phosphatase [Melioribacteraceae bacterium]|nr:SpoIIE family protein phosphatase [Melioribacteraceae bacterium]